MVKPAGTYPHGNELRALRRRLGLTQEDLAARLGVCVGSVNRWELGRVPPSPLAMRAIERLAAKADGSG